MRTNDIGLVVFWACLEAHEGIVILTTSHAVKFDEVAASRITLPIHYGPFDSKTRQKVGIQLMRRLEEDNGSLSITVKAEELWKSTLQKVMWNGHEIKSGKSPTLHDDLAKSRLSKSRLSLSRFISY